MGLDASFIFIPSVKWCRESCWRYNEERYRKRAINWSDLVWLFRGGRMSLWRGTGVREPEGQKVTPESRGHISGQVTKSVSQLYRDKSQTNLGHSACRRSVWIEISEGRKRDVANRRIQLIGSSTPANVSISGRAIWILLNRVRRVQVTVDGLTKWTRYNTHSMK